MIIEAKAYNKYLKPKKRGLRPCLSTHCLSLKLEADQPKEVGFLTFLYDAFSLSPSKADRVVIYKGRKKMSEYSV